MRFIDWLNQYRNPRTVARENIRQRQQEYRRFAGPVAAIERFEDRCVLAAPTAIDGSDSLHMNSMLMSSVNFADPDMDSLTVSLVGPTTANGSLTLNADGWFIYTPNANFTGTDSFSFQANDGESDSIPATYTITVQNTAPTAIDGSDSLHMNSMLMSSVSVADPDMDSLTVSLVGPTTANGSLTLNADGSFIYAPNANFTGTDSFSFQANDGESNSPPATFTITVANTAPTATDGSGSTDQNMMLMSSVSVSDPDMDSLTVSLVGPTTANGTLMLSSDGSFT